MTLNQNQITDIENFLQKKLRKIFQDKILFNNKEPDAKPFHERLIGKDRLALFSFVHGLNTSFGQGIFENIALFLSQTRFKKAVAQATAGDLISEEAFIVIQQIMTELTTAQRLPDKFEEIERIRKVCQTGDLIKVKPTKVDVFLESFENEFFLFDIKTVKPNIGDFKEFKRTLLEWAAVVLALNPNAKVNTLLAIPYNPNQPQPYNRWTMREMIDLPNELKVAEEFWDFLGGEGAYNHLLDIFERVGNEMRSEIDEYFIKLNLK